MKKNKLSVLSYNLCFGKAFLELVEMTQKYQPDVVCVQEFDVKPESVELLEVLGYELADYSYSFFRNFRLYSVATFYRLETVKHNNGVSINLARGMYDFLLFILRVGGPQRTALNNSFQLRVNDSQFRVSNLHLSALQSTNAVRVKQLKGMLEYLKEKSDIPTVITGDFNYMYRRKPLEALFKSYQYEEATNNLFYSLEWIILWLIHLKTKCDYIWYRGLKKVKTTRLERKKSDHFPILAQFTL